MSSPGHEDRQPDAANPSGVSGSTDADPSPHASSPGLTPPPLTPTTGTGRRGDESAWLFDDGSDETQDHGQATSAQQAPPAEADRRQAEDHQTPGGRAHTRPTWSYGPAIALLAVTLLVTVLGPFIGRRIAYEATDARLERVRAALRDDESIAALSQSFRLVAEVVEPSVVHIRVYRAGADEGLLSLGGLPDGAPTPPDGDAPDDGSGFYQPPQQEGSGSGWVYQHTAADGGVAQYILTNHHVVEGADRIRVRFKDEPRAELTAQLIGADAKTDVAVLRVDRPLHPASLAVDDDGRFLAVEQGDIVFAFGSPFQFEFSMSQGIVSGKGRRLGILRGRQGYEDFIQTDAAINPGNSGGPLTNAVGQVVGMNTAIATRTGGYNGLGFAIPVEMVVKIADQLIENGVVERGFLGVGIQSLPPELAATFGYDGAGGALVSQPIPGGAAAAAGVEAGDIITHVDGNAVDDDDHLRSMIADLPPGRKITLTIFRNGQVRTIDVTLARMPADLRQAMRQGVQRESATRGLGLTGQSLLSFLGIEDIVTVTPGMARTLGLGVTEGVYLRDVRPNSIADAAGLSAGMGVRCVVTAVDDVPVKTTDDFIREMDKHNDGRNIRLAVDVNGSQIYFLLRWPED